MEKIKILVVEDEIIIADNICCTLESLGYFALEPAINYPEAIKLIEEECPDIAILDIQLSGKKTGIDIGLQINEKYKFPFIFLTSNADESTVMEAKKVMPFAYLIKPFTKEDLFSAIEIALHNFSIMQKNDGTEKKESEELIFKDSIFIKDKGVFNKIRFKDIVYLKSDHVYVEINLKNNKSHLVRGSLNEFIAKMSHEFIRVHRSFVVNINYLEKIEIDYLIVEENKIPIGKTFRESILDRLT
jgi:two-component system, LytTR family, response regulator LytT